MKGDKDEMYLPISVLKFGVELFKHQIEVLKPYNDLLMGGIEPISDAWFEDTIKVLEFMGLTDKDWQWLCYDLAYDGYVTFEIDGEEFKATTIEEAVWAWSYESEEEKD